MTIGCVNVCWVKKSNSCVQHCYGLHLVSTVGTGHRARDTCQSQRQVQISLHSQAQTTIEIVVKIKIKTKIEIEELDNTQDTNC